MDAAYTSVDDAEEKIDTIDGTPRPTPEVQRQLHSQVVENAYSQAESTSARLKTLRASNTDGEFDPKDCLHVMSVLDLLRTHIASVV